MEAAMRGMDEQTGKLFSYVDLERRVQAKHPLRVILRIVNEALAALDTEFARLYSSTGRPSIPPEKLLRALLLQAFYSIRSERQLMEQLDYNLLFRWFVGLGVDDPVWVPTVFSKNRDRLLEAEVAAKFLKALLDHAQIKPLLSDEHFSVDGTLIEAWASMKSFQPRDGSGEPPGEGRNGERDFHDERRTNETHVSTTDPDAKLFRKGLGKEARLCFMGHALMENRSGFVVESAEGCRFRHGLLREAADPRIKLRVSEMEPSWLIRRRRWSQAVSSRSSSAASSAGNPAAADRSDVRRLVSSIYP